MGYNIKCLSWDFYSDIIIAGTWDVSVLHLCVRKGKEKSVLMEEKNFQDWSHVIKITSDQKKNIIKACFYLSSCNSELKSKTRMNGEE